MQINHVIEKADGSVVFQGVLEGKELQLVLEVGINTLFAEGALPFVSVEAKNMASIMDTPDYDQ